MEDKKPNLFSFSAKYETETELYTHIIKCYNLICNKGMTGREISTLVYYLKYGYSLKTKRMLITELAVTDNHVNVINCKLREKGLLVQDNRNEQKSFLSEEMEHIKSFVENAGTTKIIPIVFSNNG